MNVRCWGIPVKNRRFSLDAILRRPRKGGSMTTPLTLPSVISPMSRRWLVLVATLMGWACGNACGGSALAQRQVRDARLGGRVSVCSGIPERCSSAGAVVTIFSLHGTKFGKAVSKQYARHGHFSFLLVPGRYFPSAVVNARLNGGHCIAGEIFIRAHENVNVDVSCYAKLARPFSRG
jgi:hypothetical protein